MGMTVITLAVITSAVCSGTFFPQCAPTPPSPAATIRALHIDIPPLLLPPSCFVTRHFLPVVTRVTLSHYVCVGSLPFKYHASIARSPKRPRGISFPVAVLGLQRVAQQVRFAPVSNFTGLLTVRNTGINLLNFESSTKVDRLHIHPHQPTSAQ